MAASPPSVAPETQAVYVPANEGANKSFAGKQRTRISATTPAAGAGLIEYCRPAVFGRIEGIPARGGYGSMRRSVFRRSGLTVPSGARMPPWSRMFSGCLLVLLLLATPGLGRAAEGPAPPGAVPPAGEKPADVKTGSDLPAPGESEGKTEGKKLEPRLLAVPFPFFNATIGAGLGVGIIGQGYLQQPQAGFVMAALVELGELPGLFQGVELPVPLVQADPPRTRLRGGEVPRRRYLHGNRQPGLSRRTGRQQRLQREQLHHVGFHRPVGQPGHEVSFCPSGRGKTG